MPEISSYTISPRQVLGRVSVIIGASGSGKTTIVKDFISSISNHVEQAFMISQTALVNGDYEGIIPPACIHKHIDLTFLSELAERQEAFRETYDRINKPELVERMFRRCAPSRILAKVAKIHETIDEMITKVREEVGSTEDDVKQLQWMKSDLITAIKKKTIADSSSYLFSTDLTAEEKYCVEHIYFNPNVLLIFDDCTSDIEALRSKPELKELFYASRHRLITILMITHTDRALLGDLKKSAAFIVFTDRASANSYFDRKTNDIDIETKRTGKKYAMTIIGTKSDPEPLRFQRLVFADGQFYKYTAKISPNKCILAPILQRFCEQVENSRDKLGNNKYAKMML